MIFLRLDENLSFKIAGAARLIGIPPDLVIETPKELGQTGATDLDWIGSFVKRGRPRDIRCALTGDGRMRDNEPERAAAEDAGILLLFVPSPGWWRPLKREGQAAYVLRWLPTIREIALKASKGSQFKLPGTFTPRTDLKPLPSVVNRVVSRPGRPKGPRKPSSLL